MNPFQNTTVTKIYHPLWVSSQHGRLLHVKNRKSFGLSFCVSGEIVYTQNGRQFISDPARAVLLPMGHPYELFGSKTGDFTLVNFLCDGLVCDTILEIPLQDSAPFIRDFEQMMKLSLFPSNRLQLFSLFYATLDRLSLQQLPQSNILLPAMRYLEDNLSDPSLCNRILAQQANISEVYFRKLFQAHYRMPPRQYILQARIQKAQQLLLSNHVSVTEIAEACGFSNVYHFCRIFKNKTGFTPTEFAGKNRPFSI